MHCKSNEAAWSRTKSPFNTWVYNMPHTQLVLPKGTVQRKLRGVKNLKVVSMDSL
jgi:hypothetical protein